MKWELERKNFYKVGKIRNGKKIRREVSLEKKKMHI